jgi:Tfp pilus assembly PilM family ATPase
VRYRFSDNLRSLIVRRLIAIDLGSSHIKVILAEETFGQIRLLQHQVIDLQEEGLLSAEEINRHVQKVINELGNHPVALAIPQHLCLSHLVNLPRVRDRELKKLVEQQTINLSGLSESSIVYDYRRLKPSGRHPNPFWITISREHEIETQINRLGSDDTGLTVCEVTTVANALISACLAQSPYAETMVLVDLGATSTVVAILEGGQGVYAASFPIGGESFTGALASLKKCSFEEAELIKRSQNLFDGPGRLKGFSAVVDIWHQDLGKILKEWEPDQANTQKARRPMLARLSGGGADQPGLLTYLQKKKNPEFQTWPEQSTSNGDLAMGRFAVAYGLVQHSFKRELQTSSLLPKTLRATKQRHQQLMAANWAGFGLMSLLLALLLAGSAHKLILNHQKGTLAANAEAALKKAQAIETLIQQRELEYARLTPLLEHQKESTDILKTLHVLQKIRERRDLWFVLFADQQSYFAGATSRPADTNLAKSAQPLIASNLVDSPAGYIVELCLPGQEDSLKALNELVAELKKEKLFQKVDVLPASQKATNLVDPKLILPDRHFSLSLELAEKELPRPFLAQPKRLEPRLPLKKEARP